MHLRKEMRQWRLLGDLATFGQRNELLLSLLLLQCSDLDGHATCWMASAMVARATLELPQDLHGSMDASRRQSLDRGAQQDLADESLFEILRGATHPDSKLDLAFNTTVFNNEPEDDGPCLASHGLHNPNDA